MSKNNDMGTLTLFATDGDLYYIPCERREGYFWTYFIINGKWPKKGNGTKKAKKMLKDKNYCTILGLNFKNIVAIEWVQDGEEEGALIQ